MPRADQSLPAGAEGWAFFSAKRVCEIPPSATSRARLAKRIAFIFASFGWRLAAHQLLVKFRIARPCELDVRGGAFDGGEIFRRQFDVGRREVLVRTIELRGAGDRNDPCPLREQPGERDLSRCRFLLFREGSEQVHQSLVLFPILRAKARNGASKIRAVELRLRGDLACQESFAERAERNESDPEFLKRRQD